ncbi:MAG: hypothetical protein LUJ09_08455 [Firmicutes bacterium]|nr:hypothetical protein [Bacillota bacterium]
MDSFFLIVSQHVRWWVIFLTAGMMLLVFLSLWLLGTARAYAEKTLRMLYHVDTPLYLERLEHNRLLRLVFRNSVLLLYRLEGQMKLGNDADICALIAQLDKQKLQPRDRLAFYQSRLSYFASAGNGQQARISRDQLVDFLCKTKANRRGGKYQKMIEDANQIIGVYVDRDTSLIPLMKTQAAATADPVERGILQYRLAKLYHFSGDSHMVQIYLKRARKNLQNSYYSDMIKAALEDHTVLERE